MPDTKILLMRELPAGLTEAIASLAPVDVLSEPVPDTARVLLATALDPVTAETIAALPPSVGLIANIGVGIDNIDLVAAAQRGLQVSNTPMVGEDTADLAWALLLSASRRLSASEACLRRGDWGGAMAHVGQRVHGKTLGLIGFGAIGQAVARRAAGFDMPVLYHGPRRKPQAEAGAAARYCESLPELLAQSDFVSLHCPLEDDTRHMIDAEALAQMKPDAVLVNTGRGALIDEAALVAALGSGHLGAVGLDVFEFEPRVTPELLNFDNVTLLPHIGSATGECRIDMVMRVYANIQAYLESGSALDHCLPQP